MPLDNPQFGVRLPSNAHHPQTCIRRTFHPCIANAIDVEKVADRIDLEAQAPALSIEPDRRKHSAGMFGYRRAILVGKCESRFQKSAAIEYLWRRSNEIHPVNE